MGKGKKNKQNENSDEENVKLVEAGDNSNNSKEMGEDTTDLISTAQGLKEEGNRLFQRKVYEGAMLKYEKAIRLLPKNHIELPNIHANMASCYMQLGLSEYPKAIRECNLALKLDPKYTKALLKRAKCYEALNKLDLAFSDVCVVLKMEPGNLTALEISERVKKTLESKGLRVIDTVIELPPEYVERPSASPALQVVDCKTHKKKGNKDAENCEVGDVKKKGGTGTEKAAEKIIDKKCKKKIKEKGEDRDKAIVEEALLVKRVEERKKAVKLVHGEDIRWAKMPLSCSVIQLREVIHDRFPSLRAVHVKYKDQEGDLLTITTDEELALAEASEKARDSIRLYVIEVSPQQDPLFGRFVEIKEVKMASSMGKFKETIKGSCNIEDWMIEFAQLFKNHIELESNTCLNLHELGMKVNAEAMEETVTSEEAQDLFDTAAEKFQEMAAKSLLNLGNVHTSRARKVLKLSKDASREEHEAQLDQIKAKYEWAQEEFMKAKEKYEEALRTNPALYEALIALALQQFEQAKLSWYYALGSNVDLESWPGTEALQLYEYAEANIDKSMKLSEASRQKKVKYQSQNRESDGSSTDKSTDKAAELATNIRTLISFLQGTVLFERSIMEFKIGLSVWQDHLEAAIKKFELPGASSTDFAAIMKNLCSNNNALNGLGLQVHDMVGTWNEICEAKDWKAGVLSGHLEQILQRRVAKNFYLSST